MNKNVLCSASENNSPKLEQLVRCDAHLVVGTPDLIRFLVEILKSAMIREVHSMQQRNPGIVRMLHSYKYIAK